jgi:hypothetical protein
MLLARPAPRLLAREHSPGRKTMSAKSGTGCAVSMHRVTLASSPQERDACRAGPGHGVGRQEKQAGCFALTGYACVARRLPVK